MFLLHTDVGSSNEVHPIIARAASKHGADMAHALEITADTSIYMGAQAPSGCKLVIVSRAHYLCGIQFSGNDVVHDPECLSVKLESVLHQLDEVATIKRTHKDDPRFSTDYRSVSSQGPFQSWPARMEAPEPLSWVQLMPGSNKFTAICITAIRMNQVDSPIIIGEHRLQIGLLKTAEDVRKSSEKHGRETDKALRKAYVPH